MKTANPIVLATFCLLSFSLNAQLSGTYFINSNGGGDFFSLTSAMNAARTQGVSGLTTFRIAPGHVENNINVVDPIIGTSISNRIIIRSQNGNRGSVTLNDIFLHNTDFIEFRNLTLGDAGVPDEVMRISQCSHILVSNASIAQQKEGVSLSASDDVTFKNVKFAKQDNGYYEPAIHNSLATGSSQRLSIQSCQFTGDFGTAVIKLQSNGIQDLILEQNLFGNFKSPIVGGVFAYVFGDSYFLRNNYVADPYLSHTPYYQDGFRVHGIGSAVWDRTEIANNMISCGGIALTTTGNGNFNVWNNSTYSAYRSSLTVNCTAVDVRNNIFLSGRYDVTYHTGTFIQDWDNNMYTSNSYSSFFHVGLPSGGILPSTPYDLVGWRAFINGDYNSIETTDPGYSGYGDLHILDPGSYAIDNAVQLSSVTKDIDGEKRKSNPDIGADECSSKRAASPSTVATISTYPNPTDGMLFFEGLDGGAHPFELLDLGGRVVMNGMITHNALDLSQIGSGHYLLRLDENAEILRIHRY